jgi:ATP synthase protein I
VDDPDRQERLKRLEDRINALKGVDAPTPHMENHYSQAQLAWRMVIELVAGLGIGFGMGYGLDYLFGTIPIFLVLFTLLGLAAGIKTMMRSANEIQLKNAAETLDAERAREGDEKRMTDGH